MQTRFLGVVGLVGVGILAAVIACGGTSSSSSSPLSCGQTIDAFCATASPPCARTVNPSDLVGSYCDGTRPGASFGTASCAKGGKSISTKIDADTTRIFEYEPGTNKLVAVYDFGLAPAKCVAGPASFTTDTCTGFAVGYQCGQPADGGADGAADAKAD